MKQATILLTILFAFGFYFQSCSDDAVPNTELLEGTWTAVSYESTETFLLEAVGQTATFTNNVQGIDLNYEVTFEAETYTTRGSYALAIETVDANSGLVGNDTLLQSDGAIMGNQTPSDAAVMMDNVLYTLTLEEEENIEVGAVFQNVDYEINSAGTELILYQDFAISLDLPISGQQRYTINSTSVWRKL